MSIRLIALDMDGTITQHKTPLGPANRHALDMLRRKYRLVMVGAGSCMRIHNQLERYPIDVIGCYGMEFSQYDEEKQTLVITEKTQLLDLDREGIIEKARILRERFGFTQYTGDSVEFHNSGMLTFALLGTKAAIQDKLAFDPDRSRRKPAYPAVCEAFWEYTTFIGGSSSFDIVPQPYNKLYALDKYCELQGYRHDEVVFIGDDYGPGGNDEQVFASDIRCLKVDNYQDFPAITAQLL